MRQRRKMSVATKIKKADQKVFTFQSAIFYKYLAFFRLIFFSQMICLTMMLWSRCAAVSEDIV